MSYNGALLRSITLADDKIRCGARYLNKAASSVKIFNRWLFGNNCLKRIIGLSESSLKIRNWKGERYLTLDAEDPVCVSAFGHPVWPKDIKTGIPHVDKKEQIPRFMVQTDPWWFARIWGMGGLIAKLGLLRHFTRAFKALAIYFTSAIRHICTKE